MPPPYIAQVSMAGMDLQNALGLFQQAQLIQGLGGRVAVNDALGVLRAVEAVPGVIAPADAAKIRELLQAGDSNGALQKLAAYQGPLQQAHAECAAVPTAASLELARVAALFGIAPEEFVEHAWRSSPALGRSRSQAEPLIPGEARTISVEVGDSGRLTSFNLAQDPQCPTQHLVLQLGRNVPRGNISISDPSVSAAHAEIFLHNGVYVIQDRGSRNGTYCNGRRLVSHEWVPIQDGARLSIGRCPVVVRLPYARRLAALTERLKDLPSYRAVFAALEQEGFADIVPRIKAILELPIPVDERLERLRAEIPYDGGLLFKLESFLLRGEVIRLRSLYFPRMTPEEALQTGERLAASLKQARSFADLAGRLRRTNADGFGEWIEKIERLGFGVRGAFLLRDFPRVFGLREQVERLFLEGLSLSNEQRQDFQWRGVTPDVLAERPWRKTQVSPSMEAALGRFRQAIGKRLNLDTLDSMEETLRTSFGDEQDEPSQSPSQDEPPLARATQMVLYKEYQAEKPTPSQLMGRVTESKRPEFFDKVWEHLQADGIHAMPDGYWFFGGLIGGGERFEGRIYLSLRRRHAEAIFRYLSGVIDPAVISDGGRIQYKIAGNPEGYSRSDSGVIYFHARNQRAVYRAVREMHRAHPEFFKEGNPHFTMPLKDEFGRELAGLSFGEHPKTKGLSFGSLRTEAMTTAVRVARALMGTSEPPDWPEIVQMCAYFLKRAGVDIENPAFNDRGREKFGPLLEICNRQEVPVGSPPASEQDFLAAVAAKLKGSLPCLNEPGMAPVVRTFAENVHRAWKTEAPKAGATTALFEGLYRGRLKWMREHLRSQSASLNEPLKRLLAETDAYFLVN
jgi:FHA domain-containing protein/type III HopA1-like effector protein